MCVWIRESFAEMISLTRRSILFGAGLVNKQPAAVASLATGCLNSKARHCNSQLVALQQKSPRRISFSNAFVLQACSDCKLLSNLGLKKAKQQYDQKTNSKYAVNVVRETTHTHTHRNTYARSHAHRDVHKSAL